MKIKYTPLVVLLLFCSLLSFANSGGKDKKDDPDLNGSVVQAETGKPIKDVNITAYSAAKKEKTAISDVNGNFVIVDLKPGTYKFVFQKDGFEKVVREKMVIRPREGCVLSIQMTAEENVFDLMLSPFRFSSE